MPTNETWRDDYCQKFGLCQEKSTKCDCYRELKFIAHLLSLRDQEWLARFEEILPAEKEIEEGFTVKYSRMYKGFNICLAQIKQKLSSHTPEITLTKENYQPNTHRD